MALAPPLPSGTPHSSGTPSLPSGTRSSSLGLLFVLSKENRALSAAEARLLHGLPLDADGHAGELRGDLLLLPIGRHELGLAFTREVHEVLARSPSIVACVSAPATKPSDILLDAIGWESLPQPFCVRTHDKTAETEFAAAAWRRFEAAGVRPRVDLAQPATELHRFRFGDRLLVTRLLWRNEERFSDRRPHLRPRNHPTGLSPKLARALINLAGTPSETKTVLDPFCGAGGLLLEGCLAGRDMTGTDIDQAQVRRAEENLAAFRAAATLTVADARRCDALGRFDAIVTDLPYGKNSRLEDAAIFPDFLAAAQRATTRLVVAHDASLAFEAAGWRLVASFGWYLHKGLSKTIRVYALTQNAAAPR